MGRLRGWTPGGRRAGVAGALVARHRQFRRAFPELDDEVDAQFARFWNGVGCTHAEMVAFATSSRAPRCQLCRLPAAPVDRAAPRERVG